MKLLIILSILFSSCSQYTCPSINGGKEVRDKGKFRARLLKIEKLNPGYRLEWKRMNERFATVCPYYPDSLTVGKYYCI